MTRVRQLGPAARPFLKWAGGKTQLLAQFASLYPPARRMRRYLEPFVGSGAVFFHLLCTRGPARAVLADSNEELIAAYRSVRDHVEAVIRALREHRKDHGKQHYYRVRAQDPARLAPPARAARLLYLNRTCFNGLYRVNSRGRFNVPMGRYSNPAILDAENLRAASAALRRTTLKVADFRETLAYARRGDFIYIDPPYDPLSPTSSFTSYTEAAFGRADQEDLARVCEALDRIGCRLMVSNSDTVFIRRLYGRPPFRIRRISARRNINAHASGRGRINEVVILNYDPPAEGGRQAI